MILSRKVCLDEMEPCPACDRESNYCRAMESCLAKLNLASGMNSHERTALTILAYIVNSKVVGGEAHPGPASAASCAHCERARALRLLACLDERLQQM